MPNTSCFPVAAPDVELIDLAGNPWRLWDALKSGSVLLAFIKTSGPTCAFTLPFLQRLHEQASPASPAILAVSQDDAATTSKYLQHFGIRLPAAIDKAWDFAAGTAFGIRNVPALFLIEPDKSISLAAEGFCKADLETLGARFGGSPFQPGEMVPEFRPG